MTGGVLYNLILCTHLHLVLSTPSVSLRPLDCLDNPLIESRYVLKSYYLSYAVQQCLNSISTQYHIRKADMFKCACLRQMDTQMIDDIQLTRFRYILY
jgi:hypothetical protein